MMAHYGFCRSYTIFARKVSTVASGTWPENAKYEAKVMRIETLMSAADAAGYSMVSEEMLSDSEAYPETDPVENEASSTTSLAVWQPVSPSGAMAAVNSQLSQAWGWFVGRIAGGAAA